MSEDLVQFLAREHDRAARPAGSAEHPDENDWALLADGLLSRSGRDDLIAHCDTCPACRRRMSATIGEWDDAVRIDGEDASTADRPDSPRILLLYRPSFQYAIAASVVIVVGLSLYFGIADRGYGVDERGLVPADAPLTALGIDLSRRSVRAELPPAISDERYRDVLERVSDALTRPEPPPDALSLATRAALSASSFEDAAEYAARWEQTAPDDPAASNALGMAEYRRGRYQEALAAFEQAIARAPNVTDFRLNAALAADEADEIERAAEHLRRLREMAPEHPRIGEIQRWLGRLTP